MKRFLLYLLIPGILGSWSISAYARQVELKAQLDTPVILSGEPHKVFLKVSLTGFTINQDKERSPVNVAIVLDRSGSMRGEKLARAKDAAILAVELLQPTDTLSIVTYESEVDVLLPATRVENKTEIIEKLNAIEAAGQTALYAGVLQGATEIRKSLNTQHVNRIILLSDGQANIGPESPAELGQLGTELGKSGISVTTIGLGMHYNEDLMVKLAGYSDGNHAFVKDAEDLAEAFNIEFGDVLSVVAQDVNINIHCPNGIRPLRVLGREAHIDGQSVKAHLNQLYSAQEKYLMLEVAVDSGQDQETRQLAKVDVTYINMAETITDTLTSEIEVTYSSSTETIDSERNKGVVVSAVKLISNEDSKRAIVLRDQGKRSESAALLRQSSRNIRSMASKLGGVEGDELHAYSLEFEKDARNIEDTSKWPELRKSLSSRQYKVDKQQR